MSTATESDWTMTRHALPPDSGVVIAMDPEGVVNELAYVDGQWWVANPDGISVYHWYPLCWKPRP